MVLLPCSTLNEVEDKNAQDEEVKFYNEKAKNESTQDKEFKVKAAQFEEVDHKAKITFPVSTRRTDADDPEANFMGEEISKRFTNIKKEEHYENRTQVKSQDNCYMIRIEPISHKKSEGENIAASREQEFVIFMRNHYKEMARINIVISDNKMWNRLEDEKIEKYRVEKEIRDKKDQKQDQHDQLLYNELNYIHKESRIPALKEEVLEIPIENEPEPVGVPPEKELLNCSRKKKQLISGQCSGSGRVGKRPRKCLHACGTILELGDQYKTNRKHRFFKKSI